MVLTDPTYPRMRPDGSQPIIAANGFFNGNKAGSPLGNGSSLYIPAGAATGSHSSPSLLSTSGILLATSPFDFARRDQTTVDFKYGNRGPAKHSQAINGNGSNIWARIEPSRHAVNTVNPIRRIVDVMSIKPNPEKELIKLHLGDPTLTGTLNTDPAVVQALEESIHSNKYNGYGPAVGLPEVRESLARHISCPEAPVTPDDIVLTSGCSHALQLAIEVLGNAGDNMLVPNPGFPLYGTLMNPHGIEDRQYNLLMDKGWEIDVKHMESLIDENTKAIVVNNPSNPCGAVYSKQHLQSIMKVAEKYRIPIIADEIYGGMTFGGAEFVSVSKLTPKVPVIVTDGIAKRYLVPGWRLGWLVLYDHMGALTEVKMGLKQLATKIVGPCALIQGALPAILEKTPQSFFDSTIAVLEENAAVAFAELEAVPGLTPVKPQGAMYMMVGLDMKCFPDLKDELEFTKALIAEESIYCLPGAAFNYSAGAIRLVMTYTTDVTREACQRIQEFCQRHYLASSPAAARAKKISVVDTFSMDILAEEENGLMEVDNTRG